MPRPSGHFLQMSQQLLTLSISAINLPAVRTQARKVGVLSGLEALQQTRFSTAVSEIARNAVQYAGGGSVSFMVEDIGAAREQGLVAVVADEGRGIEDVAKAMSGLPDAIGRIPMGLVGSSRLVDRLLVEPRPTGGTSVRLEMKLPRTVPRLTPARLDDMAAHLAELGPLSASEEVEEQNRELLKIHQELRAKQAELERADTRKNQFVATLAHELRNPLGTLKLAVDLMRKRPTIDPDEITRRADLMERQTRQMSQLVEDLMETAQIAQGKVVLAKELADLNELVAQSVEMSAGSTAAKGHQVTLRLADVPAWVQVDRRRMKQVLCNLIHNSARYTAPNGSIVVSVSCAGGKAAVEVEDNGRGIEADLLPHIFGLFVQGEGSPGECGLGVGLALVRRLVEDHQGAVEARSDGAGQGSVFTVTLPLSTPREA